MTHGFLDTSIVLRLILGEAHSFKGLSKFENLFASELLRVEAFRAIDRMRIQHVWDAQEVAERIESYSAVAQKIDFVPLQPSILKRASEPYPTILRTLDALHLATVLQIQSELHRELLFITHDSRQGIAAKACGLKVEGLG